MTVYIEYVLIDNFVIDYLLLKATFAITGSNFSRWRLFLCAFLGAGFALVLPLLQFNQIIVGAIKVAFGLIMVAIAVKHRSKKEFYINLVVFFALTFATGGIIIGVFMLFGLNYSAEISIAVMVIPVYLVIRALTGVVKFIYRRKSVMTGVCETEICVYGNSKKGKGFFDTGNALYDGESPVIVCGVAFAKGLIDGALTKPIRRIRVQTVAGAKQLTAIKTEWVKIYISDKLHIFNNVTLCVTKNSVGAGYDVILHPDLLKENDDDGIKEISSKAS